MGTRRFMPPLCFLSNIPQEICISQAVEKPASLGFFDNKRKKDVADAAAL
jgi:hypothetical protein